MPLSANAGRNAAIRINPDLAVAYRNRGAAYLATQRYAPAIADCNRSLELNSDDASTLDSRGWAYLRSGDDAKALQDFSAAVANDPKMAASFFGRSLIERKQGDRLPRTRTSRRRGPPGPMSNVISPASTSGRGELPTSPR